MIYILAMWAGFAVLALLIPKKYYKFYYFLMVCALSWLAFHINPLPAMDLFRYYNTMDLYRVVGWHWVLQNDFFDNPLATVYFYLIALLEDNRFLPAITVFLVYAFSFGLLYKASVRFACKKSEIIVALLFFMLNFNYFYVVDVIRIYLCYAIMAYFLYMDLVEKKHRWLCAVVYVAVCFIHYVILLIVFVRLLMVFIRYFKGPVANIGLLLFPPIVWVAYRIFIQIPTLSGIFELAGRKGIGYLSYDVFGVWQFIDSLVRLFLALFIGLFTLWLCKRVAQKAPKENVLLRQECSAMSDYTYFGLFSIASTFGFISNYQMMLRTPNFVQIVFTPIVLYTLSKLREKNRTYLSLWSFVIIIESIANFVYLLVYVYSSAKFF